MGKNRNTLYSKSLHSFDKIALHPDDCVTQSFQRHSNSAKSSKIRKRIIK